MARIILENFRGGLDSTRPELAASPETLVSAINIDISRGGDIVKAKEFVARHSLPAGTFGLASSGANLVVFGSATTPVGIPSGITYQRLRHADLSTAMTGVLWVEKYDGKLYVIAEFEDGQVYHYYDGTRITSWDNVQTAITSLDQIAARMAAQINGSSTAATATSNGAVVTITGKTGGDSYVITKSTTNVSAGTNDQDITLAAIRSASGAVAEVQATGSFTLSQTGSGGSINGVTVDGVSVLGLAVDQQSTLVATVQAVVNGINATPLINYTASISGSDTVVLTANTGLGATVNGLVISVVVDSPIVVESVSNMAGGVSAAAAITQQDTATMTGTVEAGDVYKLTIDGETFTVNTGIGFVGSVAKTLQTKVYSTVGSLLRFSGVANPEYWENQDPGPPVVVGAGFINMANQDGGSEGLVGLGIYQSRLAVLARNSTQIWAVDVDPDLNTQQQVIPNVGTFAPKSVVSFGDIDLFFLSDKGVRSLRVRDSSTFASVNDVGTPIDTLVNEHVSGLSSIVAEAAVATIDPINGRFMLAVGEKVYVYSFFPNKKIAAWTEYNPGFVISDFVVKSNEIFARSGSIIYQLGGVGGDDYTDSATVVLPWVDANSTGSFKHWQGIDVICEGEWSMYAAQDPSNPENYELIANLDGSTVSKERVPFEGWSSAVKFKFVNESDAYASISVVACHYKSADDD